MNQCDGCRQRLPKNPSGNHVKGGLAWIGCTAWMYESKAVELVSDVKIRLDRYPVHLKRGFCELCTVFNKWFGGRLACEFPCYTYSDTTSKLLRSED